MNPYARDNNETSNYSLLLSKKWPERVETSNFKNGSQDRDRQRKAFQIQPTLTKDIDLTFLMF